VAIDRTQKEISVLGGTGPDEIRDLRIEFVIPDGGKFGREKHVSIDEATAAKVSYRSNGQLVQDKTMSVPDALALVDQATRDGAAEVARVTASHQQQNTRATEIQAKLANLACPVCGGRTFEEHLSREDSQWGMTTFRMRLLICRDCSHVMQFALGRSLFVPG
jgi:hypothetical protein